MKVATRPATVGATWLELFQPGTPSSLSLEARVRVVADIAGALIQIHENSGIPRQHRRHGRLTPRHVLIGVDGSASLFNAKEPFSKLLPPQPDLGYLAPELLTQTGPATQQSDIFSMGVLLWEALDNGRLFPHRRAAAISRLIARKSLPNPRIEEEWALRLGEVAMRALSDSPDERYPDATALWLALREHLPPPDNARAALAREAQRALKLELTSEIREAPPYLAPGKLLLTNSLAPERDKPVDSVPIEASARYSLRPEPSSRQLGGASAPPVSATENDSWALSEPPRPTSRPAERPAARFLSQPPKSEPPASAREVDSAAPRAERASLIAAKASHSQRPDAPRTTASQAPADPPISTLQVNLPRDIVDASLPLYVSSHPAQRPFPWGALSFAAVIFFGVGAAVAFGAVSALRNPAPAARELPPEPRPFIVQALPVSAAPGAAGSPAASANPAAAPEAAPANPTNEPPASASRTETPSAAPARASGSEVPSPPQKRTRAPRPKPRAPKAPPAPAAATGSTEAPPAAPAAPETEKPSEPLPFVEQPY